MAFFTDIRNIEFRSNCQLIFVQYLLYLSFTSHYTKNLNRKLVRFRGTFANMIAKNHTLQYCGLMIFAVVYKNAAIFEE